MQKLLEQSADPMAQVGHGWSVENIGYTLGTPKIHWSSIILPVRIAILGYNFIYIYIHHRSIDFFGQTNLLISILRWINS